jgi:hypothetical protein
MTIYDNGKPVYPLPDELKHFQERDLKWLWRTINAWTQERLGNDAGLSFYERTTRITTVIRSQRDQKGYIQQLLAEHQERVIVSADVKLTP